MTPTPDKASTPVLTSTEITEALRELVELVDGGHARIVLATYRDPIVVVGGEHGSKHAYPVITHDH